MLEIDRNAERVSCDIDKQTNPNHKAAIVIQRSGHVQKPRYEQIQTAEKQRSKEAKKHEIKQLGKVRDRHMELDFTTRLGMKVSV